MLTQKFVITQIKKLAEEIKQSGIHLNKIILFGSYARNEQHSWSDIDVAIVADEFIGIGFEDVKLFARLLVKRSDLNIQAPHLQYPRFFFMRKDPFY